MTNNSIEPEVVLSIIKNASGKVLMIKRNVTEKYLDNTELTWVFPGGKIIDGETAEEAVVRETKQETGYNVNVLHKISERIHPSSKTKLTYFACELTNLKVKPIRDIHEVDKVKWLEPSEIRDFITTDLDSGVAIYLGL